MIKSNLPRVLRGVEEKIMKTIRRTFVTMLASVLSVVFALLFTVLVASACSEKVTLRFETGDGTYLSSVEGSSGSTYQKPQDPEKSGYFFDGWYLNAECEGESLPLPDVMPEQSVTFYAKYVRCPTLTLNAAGGELSQTEHAIRPGTALSDYLSAYEPQKSGLLFGGWTRENGEPLKETDVMTEEDLTLSARYRAAYSVDVYLQSAEAPGEYEKSEELCYTGTDWENADFTAQAAGIDHFRYEPEKSKPSGVLRAGENLFELRYAREELTVRYLEQTPVGRWEEREETLLYGAQVLPATPSCPEGYVFFGWRDGSGAEYAAGEAFALRENVVLSGVWGKRYPNLRGEGELAVELGEGDRRAVYTEGGESFAGEFYEKSQTFAAGARRGRLEREGFLPDDSGTYTGFDLISDASGERFGTLALDFESGGAEYRFGGKTHTGRYSYLYCEAEKRYTGDYLFESGEENFRFRLRGGNFVREGEEKGVYEAYSYGEGEFLGDVLSLDGYGGGVWKGKDEEQAGEYRGGATAGEWRFMPENGQTFSVLLGKKAWKDREEFAARNAFLYRDERLAGEFSSADGGTLLLDGYGIEATYSTQERTATGGFVRTGDLIELNAGEGYRFTLTGGGKFALTGEEYGEYAGERGTLFLNGAGAATLAKRAAVQEGCYYRRDGDYCFEGKDGFRFRLEGEEYLLFDETRCGSFRAFYGPALVLDGYGGGVYTARFAEAMEVDLLYCGESLVVLRPAGDPSQTLALSLDRAEGTVAELPTLSAGVYPVAAGGEETGEFLALDGMSAAVLFGGEKPDTYREKQGTYQYFPATREVLCAFSDEVIRYKIAEEGGTAVRSELAGAYSNGADALTLDGYGGAVYRGEKEIVASYAVNGNAAEIDLGSELLRFSLSGGEFVLRVYTRYFGTSGEKLYLERDGVSALLRGETALEGWYGDDHCFFEGASFFYRVKGENYYVYRREQERAFRLAAGGTLVLDGCGFGTLSAGEEEREGEAAFYLQKYVYFSDGSGEIGFVLGENGLEPLGAEFGLYRSPRGEGELFLQGDGAAYYSENGVWRSGEYASLSGNEYLLSLGGEELRFRAGEGTFELYDGSLAAYEGTYQTAAGELKVDGYGASFGGRTFEFVCAGRDGFVARERGTDRFYAFRLGADAQMEEVGGEFVPRR